MLAQAIALESPEQVQELTRRDVFVRLMRQYEPALRRLAGDVKVLPVTAELLFPTPLPRCRDKSEV